MPMGLIITMTLSAGLAWIGCGEDEEIPIPATPVNVHAEIGLDHVQLRWEIPEPSRRKQTFQIYRLIESENELQLIATIDQTHYKDFSAVPDTRYFYQVSTVEETSDGEKTEGAKSSPIRIDFFLPKLSVDPAKLDFGQSASQAKFRLGNQGQAILHWTVAGVVDWLALDLTTGAIEPNQSQVVTVTVQRDLSPDRYQANLNVRVTGAGSITIPVFLEVVPEPKLWISSSQIQFGYTETSKDLMLKNSGTGALEWSLISPENWLVIEPARGRLETETTTVRLAVDRRTLNPGQANTTLTLSTGTGEVVPISVSVNTAISILGLSATTIDFGPDNQRLTVALSNIGQAKLSWKISRPPPHWMRVIPSSGALMPEQSTAVRLTVDRSLLAAGQHQLQVEFTGDSNSQQLEIAVQRQGEIFGLVQDGRTGQPLAQAEIYLRPYQTESRPDGKFVLPFDQEGNYTLDITARQYIGRSADLKTDFGQGKITVDLSPIPQLSTRIVAGKHLSHPIRVAFAGQSAYISNELQDPRVTVVDPRGSVSSIRIDPQEKTLDGEHPVGIAVAVNKIYLALSDIDKIAVVEANSGRETHRFTVGDYPVECVASANGRWLYVSLQRENRIAVVDLTIPARVSRIIVGSQPGRLLIREDTLYVCNYGDGTISAINLRRRKEVLRIRVGQQPTSLSIAHRGRYLYVLNSLSDDLSLIDLRTHREVARTRVSTSPIDVSVAREPSGRELAYVGDRNGTIQIFEITGHQAKPKLAPQVRLETGSSIQQLQFNPEQQRLIVLGKRQIAIFTYDR